jgi:hypothetical protein
MERKHGVPVDKTEQPSRLEDGGLTQPALRAARFNSKIEQRFAGHAHFGAQ